MAFLRILAGRRIRDINAVACRAFSYTFEYFVVTDFCRAGYARRQNRCRAEPDLHLLCATCVYFARAAFVLFMQKEKWYYPEEMIPRCIISPTTCRTQVSRSAVPVLTMSSGFSGAS